MGDTSSTSTLASGPGTSRFAGRHAGDARRFKDVHGLTWSGVGIGTYLGSADEATDALVSTAVTDAVRGGINVIDTAANYRGGRGELAVGKALEKLFASGDAARDELILCTKAGYLPTSAEVFKDTYLGRDGIAEEDLVGGNHCMHPAYIEDRIAESMKSLNVDAIDVFYVHNPEAQLAHVSRERFDKRLAAAFEVLEGAAMAGRIGCYGLATWRAFRASPVDKGYISLAGAKSLAGSVARGVAGGGEDHFRCVQMPLALSMPEAVSRPTQWVGDGTVPAVAAARLLGLAVVSSGSIGKAKLGALNEGQRKWLGEDFTSDHQRALQFSRSASGLTTALVGMKTPDHVAENLAVHAHAPLTRATFELLFRTKPV